METTDNGSTRADGISASDSTRVVATVDASTRRTLAIGIWSAWSLVALYVVYAAVLVAGGVLRGIPTDPWLATAEVLCIVCGPLQVVLLAVIHEYGPPRAKVLSRIALLWMVVMASLTMTVHFAQLTVGRGIDLHASPHLARVFGWEWPSLLYAAELAAWHLFFGLSLLFAAVAFPGRGRQMLIRNGLRVIGALCLIGLVGPAIGHLGWRMMGVFGYTVLFPIVCVLIALEFTQAAASGELSNR